MRNSPANIQGRALGLILFCMIFFSALSLNAQSAWKLVKSEGDAKGYTRTNPSNHFKEYRVTIQVKATLDAVVAIYSDLANQSKWMQDIIKASKIKSISETEWLARYEIKFPWPMDNRDAIYHITIKQNPDSKAVVIPFVSEPESYPAQKGYLRLIVSQGAWTFTPKGNGIVEVETYGFTNPEGVPAWLVNAFIIDGPVKTMLEFKKQLEIDKYKNAKVSFID